MLTTRKMSRRCAPPLLAAGLDSIRGQQYVNLTRRSVALPRRARLERRAVARLWHLLRLRGLGWPACHLEHAHPLGTRLVGVARLLQARGGQVVRPLSALLQLLPRRRGVARLHLAAP